MPDSIESMIQDSGYIPNNRLWRRWITSQMLRSIADSPSNFEKIFIKKKPYNYQWETALSEYRAIAESKSKFTYDTRPDRALFYDFDLALAMMRHTRSLVIKYVINADKDPSRQNQNNNPGSPRAVFIPGYGTVPKGDYAFEAIECMQAKTPEYYGMITKCEIEKKHYRREIAKNAGARTAINEKITVEDIYRGLTACIKLQEAVMKGHDSLNKKYAETYDLMKSFYEIMPEGIYKKTDKCPEFRASFRGAGAYFTMDNLIRFHGCAFMPYGRKLGTDESLAMLKHEAEEIIRDAHEYGYYPEWYRLFGLMKKFLQENGITYESFCSMLANEKAEKNL